MKARTTAYIELTSFELLNEARKIRKTSISKLVSIILREIIIKYSSSSKSFTYGTTKYQNKNNRYTRIHFSLPIDIYESGVELRKFNKLSLSYLINEGIKRILGNRISKINNSSLETQTLNHTLSLLDNYVIKYCISSQLCQTTSIFKLGIEIYHKNNKDLTIPDI
ncbi:MAG: hypothetical protein KAZ87_00775 [Spirochaetes bacterium]|nr:hypothetical protein [Spirochaetota bacterium]